MNSFIQKTKTSLGAFVIAALFLILSLTVVIPTISHADDSDKEKRGGRLITIHDRGSQKVILTQALTVGKALKEAGIAVDSHDAVEPNLDEKLIASDYQVNIYRARPVVVVDGSIRKKIATPYQTSDLIAKDAGVVLYPEDKVTINRVDVATEGAGLELDITRATPFNFTLYGTVAEARTLGKSVAEMLSEKGIKLSKDDKVEPGKDTAVTAGMSVRVWREGKQTVTVEEPIQFDVEEIRSADLPIGHRQVKTPGTLGKKSVSYEILVQDGKEVSRKELASLALLPPVKQVEVVGIKSIDGLSKSKGVNFFTDSRGVIHRETYYDLPMAVVMRSCGGGTYSVRGDGAKVDNQGYILIAAELGRYPRCSIVETSLGLGKVYDTGGFTSKHPDGFDLATDWSNYNGS